MATTKTAPAAKTAQAKPPIRPASAVVPAAPKGGAVTTWKDRFKASAKQGAATAASTSSGGQWVTFPAGVMTVDGEALPNNELECVVLDFAVEHNWYDKPFNPKSPANPSCFAIARDASELVPSDKSENPQGGEEGGCTGCPHNEWGTGKDNAGNATRGKACQNRMRLMLIPLGALSDGPAGIAKSKVYMLKTSVTSVAAFTTYVKYLYATHSGIPVWGAATKIKVVRDAETQHQIQFSETGIIEDESLLAALDAKIQAHQKDLFQEYQPIEKSVAKLASTATNKFAAKKK